MWGEYEDDEGKVGVIGDVQVISGNEDDETYNNVTLDDVLTLLEKAWCRSDVLLLHG